MDRGDVDVDEWDTKGGAKAALKDVDLHDETEEPHAADASC
jgi:hypothetical protein